MTGFTPAPSVSPTLPELWQGRVSLGQGSAWFEGRIGDNRPHAHPALQLALGVASPIHVDLRGHPTIAVAGVLIGSQVTHALHPGRNPVRLLYVEHESAAGRWLAAACPRGHQVLDARQCEVLQALWPTAATASRHVNLAQLIGHLAGPAPAGPCLPDRSAVARVRSVIETLPSRLEGRCTLSQLASVAALSASRFSHCFKAETGMAVRPYLRWLRLARALERAAAGEQLTAAAHTAGFADAAHLARTMRRHFGVALSDVVASLRTR